MRLPARDVIADRSLPLPEDGRAFYIFTRAALTGDQITAASRAGLRYLGPAAEHAHSFLRENRNPAHRDWVQSQSNIIGTAITKDEDRLDEETLDYYRAAKAPALPLWVSFWRKTTKAEALALIPEAAEKMRLPRSAAGTLDEERLFKFTTKQGTAELRKLAASPFVSAIGFIHPKKLHNEASRALSRADAIIAAPYNLDGTGVVVGHWDGGRVSSSHADFGGRVTNYESGGVDDHATHTAGTILGSGANEPSARGFAPAATMVAYDFNGDPGAERRSAKHAHYHEHDNHSWGSVSSAYGGYDEGAREFDFDSRDEFLVALKAAGNEGQSSQVNDQGYGFDSLPPDSTSKNVLIICATNDEGDLAGFSSRGPTNDGRMKPDVCANGVNLYSTAPGGSYQSMSGTSMATPSITGIVTLLAQLYKREHGHRWAPDLIHALLIHTATDVFHTGPDYRFGWGNANAKDAADLILADKAAPGQRIARGALREGETLEYSMEVPAGAPELRATIVWLDAAGEGTAQRRLLHDLDLEAVSPSGATKYPWTLDPANPFTDATRDKKNERDNVEQVLVDNPEAGTWKLRVKAASITDPDLKVQGFVMITSHNVDRAVERVSGRITAPGMTIPDNDPAGATVNFAVTDRRNVKSLRLHLELQHEARGDLRVELTHPDGTKAAVETEDTSTRLDIYALYPDTRSYAEDVSALFGKPAEGSWTVKVIDTAAGNTGKIVDVQLEIELDGPVPPPPNMLPVANAGKDQSVAAGATVTLDGSLSSDPDGDMITFTWTQASGPAVQIMGANTPMPVFMAPDSPEMKTLVFTLAVDDGRGGMATDDVIIEVAGNDPGRGPNQSPIAHTNGDQMVKPGTVVRLDASTSTDPDGDPLTFRWSVVGGSEIVLTDASSAIATFTAPAADMPVELGFRVEVEDGRGGIDLEDVKITIDRNAPDMPVPPPVPPGTEIIANSIGGGCACSATNTGRSTTILFALAAAALLLRRRRRS